METTAYVLGMLTIMLVAMISAIVVGIVKIVKLQKLVKESNQYFETCIQNIHQTERENLDHIYRRFDDTREIFHRAISENQSETWRQFESAGKDVTMVEQTLMNQINQAEQRSTSYTDSRIDKLVDTYFEVMGSKKIIKG
jgi:hypothetical protein